jgi:hypothetical protein
MASNDFSTTLCIRLGLSHLSILGVSHCICNQPLDAMGIHPFHCTHGAKKMVSHDVVRDVFTAIGKSAGFHVFKKTDQSPYPLPYSIHAIKSTLCY